MERFVSFHDRTCTTVFARPKCLQQGMEVVCVKLCKCDLLIRRSCLPGRPRSGGQSQRLILLRRQERHVQIAVVLQPDLVRLDTERPDQLQAALGIREDAYYPCPAFDRQHLALPPTLTKQSQSASKLDRQV